MLMISLILNQSAFQIFSSSTYENSKSQTEEKQKRMIWGQFFNFQVFELLEI